MLAPEECWRFAPSKDAKQPDPFVSLPEKIDSLCLKQPDALAISDETQQLNYRQVRLLSTHVHDCLQKLSVGREQRVVVIAKRSIHIPILLLGILRSGATYIPVDPNQPVARVNAIVADAQASCVFVDAHLNSELLDHNAVLLISDVLTPDSEPANSESAPSTVYEPVIRASDPAYMIFTSGSTGKPKGVVVSHDALMSYLEWANIFYALPAPLVMPFHTSIGFDLTVTSLFLPWLNGGSIRVHTENSDADALVVLNVMKDPSINTVKLTPSHLSLLSEKIPNSAKLRQLIVGGEDLTNSMAKSTDALFGYPIRIINEYGPTEATVGCIAHDWQIEDSGVSVPIGLPISGMSALILNESRQPQFEGVPGELYLSGRSLAQGYWNDPVKTKESFVTAPWNPEQRLYRTGDLVRVDNKRIVYLGRKDTQVKINGYRVELSEIEATLAGHPDINECVVILDQVSETGSFHELPNPVNADQEERYCHECGLSSRHPDGQFNDGELCSLCSIYYANKTRIQSYFKDSQDLEQLIEDIQTSRRGEYDALMLLSGGKDSTYAMTRLVDMGLKVFAFSLDNGYISDQAKNNVVTVCEALNVPHHFATTEHMDAIFADSLTRHSNVCNGCFKTIYTLSMQFAASYKIDYIFTGLSRGQLFETRLNNEIFADTSLPLNHIDDMVHAARIQYHSVQDAPHKLLNIKTVNNGQLPAQIAIVDFYRYHQIKLQEMLEYLKTRLGWIRPPDTGRSTNCLINDVGIHVHKIEQGFHNYSLPYSWDVRLDHKTREDALEELDDMIDEDRVEEILNKIGYQPVEPNHSKPHLRAFVNGKTDLDIHKISQWLQDRLPSIMQPDSIHYIESMPLNANGKIDRLALREREQTINENDEAGKHEQSLTPKEVLIANVWKNHIKAHVSSGTDHFFKLGGDSLSAIRCAMELRGKGYLVEPADIFRLPQLSAFATHLQFSTLADEKPQKETPKRFSSLSASQREKLNSLLSRQ